MSFMKLPLCLIVVTTLIMFTFAAASRHGEKVHFHDSSELGEFNIDERPGRSHGNRNHRGRGRGFEKQNNAPEFEQGVPGVYPIKGPAQAPLELASHPGRGIGLQKHIIQQHQQQQPPTQTSNNIYAPVINQPVQEPLNHPYAANPFLSKIQKDSVVPSTTTKSYSPFSASAINQSTSLDKTTTTTTPTYINPRRMDLFYGSNLLEEEQEEANRKNKAEESTEISFDDRGLFYSDPRCPTGQILVKTKCRTAV